MTRKRFIKLIMAQGESKRIAQQRAELARCFGIPYKIAYERLKCVYAARKAVNALAEAAQRAGSILQEAYLQIKEGTDNAIQT